MNNQLFQKCVQCNKHKTQNKTENIKQKIEEYRFLLKVPQKSEENPFEGGELESEMFL